MKRYFAVLALALSLAIPSFAQLAPPTTDQIYAVRAKLIHQYVPTYVWGVSVCGYDDALNGEDYAWLCVYAYKDSLGDLAKGLSADPASKVAEGVIFVGGVAVRVQAIDRPKSK